MWRFLPHVTEPKTKQTISEKRKYYNDYDQSKRTRSFQNEWKTNRPWLVHDENGGMKCTFCLDFGTNEVKKSLFVTGCHSMKLESVIKHEESNVHKKCASIAKARKIPILQSEAAKIVRTLNQDNLKKMIFLFNTAHALALKCRPFTDFKWMCQLQSKNGVQMGETYIHSNAAKTFVSFISMNELSKVSNRIHVSKFICVIGDGSTDSSIKEQEMWYVRHCELGHITTDFIGVDSCEKASAENIVTGLRNIVDSLKIEWNAFCSKLVAVSCDGASVMTGSKAGVAAILRKSQPSLLTIHCLAHRLELCIKDAAKTVKLYDKTVSVLAMGLYYFYHNSSLNRAMLKRSCVALKTEYDNDLLLPTRVGGTRWIGHTVTALQNLTVSYKYIVGHLGQLTEPMERVSVDSKSKAHAFLKLLKSKSVVLFLHHLLDVLTPLRKLSLQFQERDSIIARQHSAMESVLDVIRQYKTKLWENGNKFVSMSLYGIAAICRCEYPRNRG